MIEGSELQRLPLVESLLYKVFPGNTNPKLFRLSHIDVECLRKVSRLSSLTRRGMKCSTPKKPAERL